MTKTRQLRSLLAIVDSLFALLLVVFVVTWSSSSIVVARDLNKLLVHRVTLADTCVYGLFTIVWMRCWEALGLYERDFSGMFSLLLRTFAGSSLMSAFLWLLLAVHRMTTAVYHAVIAFFVISLLVEILRVTLSGYAMPFQYGEPERVIILGSGRLAGKAWREVRTRYRGAKQFLGFFDDRNPETLAPDIAGRFLGSVDDLPEYLLLNVVDELIIATPMRSCYDLSQRAISIAEATGVRVTFLNDAFNLSLPSRNKHAAELFYGVRAKAAKHERAELLKRCLDVSLSGIGLLLLLPSFLIIGACVKLTSPGPVFFAQERYGYGRRRFYMYKFRSMVRDAPQLLASLEDRNEASGPIFKMKNDPRVTTLGKFLRSTSLDELPQLWNVLIGDMSLVGPRPMSVRDVSLFSEAQLMRRFSVRPGITGIWQVSGRSSLTFEQWIALDFSYIDEWSLGLDLKILARTVPAVLRRHGAA